MNFAIDTSYRFRSISNRAESVLPELIELVWEGRVNPGKVFDLTLPLEQVAEGYRAMDERRAIKALLRP